MTSYFAFDTMFEGFIFEALNELEGERSNGLTKYRIGFGGGC